MNPEVAVKIFEAGKSAGADFVEIFEEETRSSSLGLKDRQIETATAGTELSAFTFCTGRKSCTGSRATTAKKLS